MNKFKIAILMLLTFLLAHMSDAQNTKLLKGRVLFENLEIIPAAKIYTLDTVLLGTTDITGYFTIEIPTDTKELLVGFVAMEWTHIQLKSSCEEMEIIMMFHIIYHDMSGKRMDRKRQRRFKQLSNKHRKAYAKHLFKSRIPCFVYVFKEYFPENRS